MFETLYKTDSPKDFANGEYYQIHLEIEIHDGKQVFFVREKHGWFNDEEKRSAHHIFTLSPQEGFSSGKGINLSFFLFLKKASAS